MTFWVAGAIAVGAVVQGVSASNAADKQASAARNAQNLQQNMYNQTVGNESQFLQAGQGASSDLNYLMGVGSPGQNGTGTSSANGTFGSLNKPFNTSDWKSLSPQYGFNLQQGQQNTLNQAAGAKGAESGAALKDLTSFNQSYANNSFNSAFQNYQTQNSNIFNRLSGIAQTGQAAASNQATGGSNYGAGIGQSAQNIGSAQAAGSIGIGNSLSSGLSNGAVWAAYGGGGNSGGFTPNNANSSTSGSFSAADMNAISSGSIDPYCDYALKEAIVPYRFDGMSQLQAYEFNYKGSPERWRGYIAQEVQGKYPAAVSRGAKGFLKVDYSQIPSEHQYPRKLSEDDWTEVDACLT